MPVLSWFDAPGGLDSPAVRGFAITPHDTNEVALTTRALWVGGAGNVAVLFLNDTVSVTLVGVPAGTMLPLGVKKVLATGTTATNIIGLS